MTELLGRRKALGWCAAKYSIGPNVAVTLSPRSCTGIAPNAVSSGGKISLVMKKTHTSQVPVVRVSQHGWFNGILHKRRAS